MKSCMRDCLPAVLLRNITSVMDDLKATDGSGDYLGEKLCLEKKFCRWLSMLREPFREQHSSACWPCLCQAAHTTFYIQSPPPPPYKGLSNGGIHLLGAVVFSCQRTKQLSRGNLTCDCQPRRWYVSRVQWFQMSDVLLPGGGQCPFHTVLGPASLQKLRLQLQISKLSTHLCGIKQNETHKSSCLRPFCGSRICSHHPWSCFTHHDAWRQVKGETEDKAGGRGKERKSACNSSKTAED